MSGIVLECRRDGAPARSEAIGAMLERLGHRGPDGHRLVVSDGLALGCQQFWTTPEDAGEIQPVGDGQLLIAFDGRLDNRGDLLQDLQGHAAIRADASDAVLVLAAFRTWGWRSFDRLLGPFAIVLWDAATKTVFLARDGLGDRTLFYQLDCRRLLVASEEFALLAHPEVSAGLDEGRVADFFAFRVPDDGSTFFAGITELQPAEVLAIDSQSCRRRRCWQPRAERGVERLSDADCIDRYRELLTLAVTCRLRSTTPPAVIMSGGLDSTSVAAIGARELRRRGKDQPMRAISWVFDELVECDERAFIDPVVSRSALKAWQVPGDDAWPLANSSVLSRNPSTPEQNAYRELKERAHLKASASGSKVALSGAAADLFSAGTEPWLWDLLRRGRVVEAATSLAADIRLRNLGHALRRAGFGVFLRPVRALVSSSVPNAPWLTAWAAQRAARSDERAQWAGAFRRPAQCAAVLGHRAARSVTAEIYDANLAGIDLRHPYRDRRLTEFMLSVPAHHLYRHGRFKHLAREAAAGLLPPEIPARTEPTLLTPLFRRGIFERELATVRLLLLTSESAWDRYVDRNWIAQILRVGPQRPHDEIVLWQCVSFESWLRRHRWGAEARQPGDWSVSLTESAA